MQQIVLDDIQQEPDYSKIEYGNFWQRLGALFVDGIILAPVSLGLTYFNVTEWKSGILMALIAIATTAYKPYMEFTYGATLGKMVLKLRVTNLQFKSADLGTILYRNIFNLVPQAITILMTFGMYADPTFQDVKSFGDFTQYSSAYSSTNFVDYATWIILIVEAIMLGSDKWSRSLHDRIAGTFVIVKQN